MAAIQGTSDTPASRWPDYLLARAQRKPPADCHIVPGSTPVVSFGNPVKAVVATLGINPSSSEFLDREKSLLTGGNRRLATLESLGLKTYEDADRPAAQQIVDDCADYFNRRPYHWFNVLNQILSSALSVSYGEASACHLDLVQWATDPIWKGLPEVVRAQLLSEDREFLIEQLRQEGYRLIIVAGRTAMSWVEKAGIVQWTSNIFLEGWPTTTFSLGDAAKPQFVGWSCNLQSQPGARYQIPQLIRELGQVGEALSLSGGKS